MSGPATAVGWVRLGWGGLLLAVPGSVLRATGCGDRVAARRIARVLGTRHTLQAAAEITGLGGNSMAGVVVDATHWASMVVTAAISAEWRRPALVSAAATGSLACATYGSHRLSAQ